MKQLFLVLFLLGVSKGDPYQTIIGRPGTLYPQESETREVKDLNGVWNFRTSPEEKYGFDNNWHQYDLDKTGSVEFMPVPSSYNDITQNSSIRDHVGLVWYDRKFFVPKSWENYDLTRVWLRFGSVHYRAKVYVNGRFAMEHEFGHLPFEIEISFHLNFGEENRITVICDNRLYDNTIPQGQIDSDGYQTYTFDFFNYAGIHRPVYIYTTPALFIEDVSVQTDIEETTGLIKFNITSAGGGINEDPTCEIEVYDKNDKLIETVQGFVGVIKITNATFWWPFLMHENPGYLYTLKITLRSKKTNQTDVYRQKVGIRTISWTNTTFLINGVEAYLTGFGRHEDSDIRGKGLDLATVTRDYNLIKWVGANTYRTSHYPYAEELYDFADREGIMIIDECPGVNIEKYNNSEILLKHKQTLTKLIKRDKNRPSVIMWSVANEARVESGTGEHFREIVEHVKSLDERPVTAALSNDVNSDPIGQYLDIISFNRYNGWYRDLGKLHKIASAVFAEAESWHKRYNKPIIMSEYGAEAFPGLHKSPGTSFTEEYQVSVISQNFVAFDKLRNAGYFIGEFIWNFADFKTNEDRTRVDGNKKGIFTRQRQPKASAHLIRKRYHQLFNTLFKTPLSKDLNEYIIEDYSERRTEL